MELEKVSEQVSSKPFQSARAKFVDRGKSGGEPTWSSEGFVSAAT